MTRKSAKCQHHPPPPSSDSTGNQLLSSTPPPSGSARSGGGGSPYCESSWPDLRKEGLSKMEIKALKKEAMVKHWAAEEIVSIANSKRDLLVDFPEYFKFDLNGLDLQVEFLTGDQLTPSLKSFITGLLKDNMMYTYGREWLTEARKKRKEMVDKNARYIFLRHRRDNDSIPSSPSPSPSPSSPSPSPSSLAVGIPEAAIGMKSDLSSTSTEGCHVSIKNVSDGGGGGGGGILASTEGVTKMTDKKEEEEEAMAFNNLPSPTKAAMVQHSWPATSADDEQNRLSSFSSAATQPDAEGMVAFVHFRFVMEEDVEVLYVYELQLVPEIRRKGVGQFLMELMENMARKHNMKGVMLTVQKQNTFAWEFYTQKMGYSTDPISPSQVDPFAEPETYSYEIFSKMFDLEARRHLEEVARVAREAIAAAEQEIHV